MVPRLAAALCLASTAYAFIPAWSAASTRYRRASILSAEGSPSRSKIEVVPAANSSVTITVEVPGTETRFAFDQAAADIVKDQKLSIPGFSTGSKIPAAIIAANVGASNVKAKALEVLADTVLKSAVAEGSFRAIGQAALEGEADDLLAIYTPGEPLPISLKIDVWPTVAFTSDYKDLSVTVEKTPFEPDRYEAAVQALRERYVATEDAGPDYAAALGDAVDADMNGFELAADGTAGDPLPTGIASGDNVEIIVQEGRYMPGMAEALIGAKKGETVEVKVTFPERASVAQIAGKDALFKITVNAVKTRKLPEIGDDFANSVRSGLTWEELDQQIKDTVNTEAIDTTNRARDVAFDQAILEIVDCEIPETLVNERARTKFAKMMGDMRDQGTPDEEIKEMITAERFETYKRVAYKNVCKELRASIAVHDIAQKEGITVDAGEIEDQLEIIRASAKGEEIDEEGAKEQIEVTIEKGKVYDLLETLVAVEYVDPAPVGEGSSVAQPKQ